MFRSAPPVEQEKFHSSRLVPLFFQTLNAPDRAGLVFPITGNRVPYLNGGLFEPDFPGVDAVDFPAPLFAALLEFFRQYHFTIDENDPEDHEIGIDLEMLGRIFENLLEDNKDKGAYYTPKPVVQYMCQQSLIHALIVDESVPTPLPNLDYQIMQGNSLLESFRGEPLFKRALRWISWVADSHHVGIPHPRRHAR